MFLSMKRFFIIIVFTVCMHQDIYAQAPLKILFMLNCFPALSATFVMGQITGLIESGHDVSIFAYRKSSEKKSHQDVERYKLLERTYFKTLPHSIEAYDIVCCQFFSTAKRFLPELIRLKKTIKKNPKVIVCCRGNDGIELIHKHDKSFQQLLMHVDLFLPVCKKFKNYLLQAGCDPKKIIVHHSAIDLDTFRYKEPETVPDGKEIIVLSIGRLVEEKGFEYAIHAFAHLEKEFPQLRYIIIGDGPLRRKLQTLIKNYKLAEKISLLGWQTRDEIIEQLYKAHIFVHPAVKSPKGYEEGIPNVLMEAMATGVPVIATQDGGIPEIIMNGIDGFLVGECDIKSLTNKIRHLIYNSDFCNFFSLMGRKKIEKNHDLEKENNKLDTILKNVVREKANA